MGSSGRFCPYLHVSMQSGSTLILKRMKRRYTREDLLNRLLFARKQIPGLILGGDLMVGFPTESEEDFKASVSLIEEADVIYPHVFPFSARPGTPAAKIPRQVLKTDRKRRAAELRACGKGLRDRALREHVGLTREVLVERENLAIKSGGYHGRLSNYMPVRLEADPPAAGERVFSQIIGVDDEVLIARAIAGE